MLFSGQRDRYLRCRCLVRHWANFDCELTSQSLHGNFAILVLSSTFARRSDDAGREVFNLNARFDFVSILTARSASSGKSQLTLIEQLLFMPARRMRIEARSAIAHGMPIPHFYCFSPQLCVLRFCNRTAKRVSLCSGLRSGSEEIRNGSRYPSATERSRAVNASPNRLALSSPSA